MQIAKQQCTIYAIPISQQPNILEYIQQTLMRMLRDKKGQWILSNTHQQRRYEFALNQHSQSIDQPSKSYCVDVSFIDDSNTLWVIDYKTAIPEEQQSPDTFLKLQWNHYTNTLQSCCIKYCTCWF